MNINIPTHMPTGGNSLCLPSHLYIFGGGVMHSDNSLGYMAGKFSF